MRGYLLDTCAMIWVGLDEKFSPDARAAIELALAESDPVRVSAVSALEIGLLASRGRQKFPIDPKVWLREFLERSGTGLVSMEPDMLIDSCFLPGEPPRDPFDRIVIATARARGLTIVTRDRAILAYGAAGHVKTLAC